MAKKDQAKAEPELGPVEIDEPIDTAEGLAPLFEVVEAPAETPEGAGPEPPPEGMVYVTYKGHAEAFTYGDIKLAPGTPTLVSKDDAEGIATTPFEDIVISDGSVTGPLAQE